MIPSTVRNLRLVLALLFGRDATGRSACRFEPAHFLMTSVFNQLFIALGAPDWIGGLFRAKRSDRDQPARCEVSIITRRYRPVNRLGLVRFALFFLQFEQGERPESNRRPPGPQPGALTD
jgi:hypothetical protein